MTTNTTPLINQAITNARAGKPWMSEQPTVSDLIHNARDEYGRGLDAFLVGWMSTLLGAEEVVKAIDAYKVSHAELAAPAVSVLNYDEADES